MIEIKSSNTESKDMDFHKRIVCLEEIIINLRYKATEAEKILQEMSTKQGIPEYCESSNKSDLYIPLHKSLLESNAWRDLNNNQKLLYITMKQHAVLSPEKGDTPRNRRKEQRESHDTKEKFYFSEHLWKNIYNISKDKHTFIKNRDSLVSHGFIHIASFHEHGNRIVYEFSDGWKTWNKQ